MVDLDTPKNELCSILHCCLPSSLTIISSICSVVFVKLFPIDRSVMLSMYLIASSFCVLVGMLSRSAL